MGRGDGGSFARRCSARAGQVGRYAAYVRVFFCARVVRSTLLGDQALLRVAQFLVDDHANLAQMVFDDRADLRDDARHVDAAGLEVAAARVEHGFQFLDEEGHVAALAEDGAHDAGDGDHPLEVVHVLRVDEDLEGAARFVRAVLVEDDVVDGHVEGVFHQRALDLVGAADEHFRALDALVHLDDFGGGKLQRVAVRGGVDALRGEGGGFVGFLVGFGDGVALDFLGDLDGHGGARAGVRGARPLGDWGWGVGVAGAGCAADGGVAC